MSERSSWSTTNSQVQQRIVRILRKATYSNKFLSIELTEHALARVRGVLQSTTEYHGAPWSTQIAAQSDGSPGLRGLRGSIWNAAE